MSDEHRQDGGSAFPAKIRGPQFVQWDQGSPPPVVEPTWSEGMSLRDYFAAKALENQIRHGGPLFERQHGETFAQQLARCAYLMADAMLEARK